MKIGDECYVHGYVDEIRNDTIIIRNEGGYFGTVKSEIVDAPTVDAPTVDAPTVDAVPARHGRWIKGFEDADGQWMRCSECQMMFYVGKGRDGNYCPNCGARMDEE